MLNITINKKVKVICWYETLAVFKNDAKSENSKLQMNQL